MWFGVRAGSVLWVASSMVMTLWMLWFGLALQRAPAAHQVESAQASAQTPRKVGV